jgi:MYXO-CTERM domain-containing protein
MKNTAVLVFVAFLCIPSLAFGVEYGGIEFPAGEQSFADAVVSYSLENPTGVEDPYDNPVEALGPPNVDSNEDSFVSLGNAGEMQVNELIVRFDDNALVDIEGDDLYIFEIGDAVEATEVAISVDGDSWIELGRIEGATRAIDLANIEEVPSDTEFRYVRIRDFADGDTSEGPFAGPDIDAIGAIGSVDKGAPADGLCLRDGATSEEFANVVFPHGVLSFADQVVEYLPGNGVRDPHLTPSNGIGTPDETGFSLGTIDEDDTVGTVTFFFRDNFFTDIAGDDLYIFEIGPQTEATFVEVSEDGETWYDVGRVRGSTSSLDLADFEGLPARGVYRFVRLRTDPEQQRSGSPFAGPDIDAVGAISSCDAVTIEDTDGDGVVDTVVDTTRTAGSADFDGDGIVDSEDACPFNPDVAEVDASSTGVECGGTSGVPDDGPYAEESELGCGCASGSGAPGSALVLLLALMFARVRARRR